MGTSSRTTAHRGSSSVLKTLSDPELPRYFLEKGSDLPSMIQIFHLQLTRTPCTRPANAAPAEPWRRRWLSLARQAASPVGSGVRIPSLAMSGSGAPVRPRHVATASLAHRLLARAPASASCNSTANRWLFLMPRRALARRPRPNDACRASRSSGIGWSISYRSQHRKSGAIQSR